jgi:hypothetical protein
VAQAITLGGADLVVDLSRVEFMDAATIGVIVWARELLRARSRSLVVRSPSTCARRVLELCELSDLVDPRPVDADPMTGAAGALGTWVPVPAVDRLAEVSPPSSSSDPDSINDGRVTTAQVSSMVADDRADEVTANVARRGAP